MHFRILARCRNGVAAVKRTPMLDWLHWKTGSLFLLYNTHWRLFRHGRKRFPRVGSEMSLQCRLAFADKTASSTRTAVQSILLMHTQVTLQPNLARGFKGTPRERALERLQFAVRAHVHLQRRHRSCYVITTNVGTIQELLSGMNPNMRSQLTGRRGHKGAALICALVRLRLQVTHNMVLHVGAICCRVGTSRMTAFERNSARVDTHVCVQQAERGGFVVTSFKCTFERQFLGSAPRLRFPFLFPFTTKRRLSPIRVEGVVLHDGSLVIVESLLRIVFLGGKGAFALFREATHFSLLIALVLCAPSHNALVISNMLVLIMFISIHSSVEPPLRKITRSHWATNSHPSWNGCPEKHRGCSAF